MISIFGSSENSLIATDSNTLTGTAHYVGPREMVAELRDGVLRRLIELGTNAALKTLRAIIVECPDLTWLPLQLSRAEQVMRMKSLGAADPGGGTASGDVAARASCPIARGPLRDSYRGASEV